MTVEDSENLVSSIKSPVTKLLEYLIDTTKNDLEDILNAVAEIIDTTIIK